MLKKTIVLTLVLFMMISVFSGTIFAQEKVELEFWTILLEDAFGDYINGLIDDYEEENPNVTVNWVDVGEPVAKFMSAMGTGNPPDVANMYEPRKFAEMGVLLNLDEAVDDEVKDKYIDSFWNGAAVYEGSNYGFPWYATGYGLWYNKELFKEAGLDPNSPPQTQKEMLEYARIIGEKTDAYGLSWNTQGWHNVHVTPIFLREGVKFFNEDKTEAVINNEKAREILSDYIKTYNEEGIPPEATSSTGRDPLNWFVEERTAMFLQGPWIIRYFSEGLKEKIEYVKQPEGDTGLKTIQAANYIVIPKQTEHPKEAVKFATYVTNYENQLEFDKQVAILPTRDALLDDSYFKQETDDLNITATQTDIEALKDPLVMERPLASNWSEMLDALKLEVDKALAGNQTAEEALANVEDKWNSLLE